MHFASPREVRNHESELANNLKRGEKRAATSSIILFPPPVSFLDEGNFPHRGARLRGKGGNNTVSKKQI